MFGGEGEIDEGDIDEADAEDSNYVDEEEGVERDDLDDDLVETDVLRQTPMPADLVCGTPLGRISGNLATLIRRVNEVFREYLPEQFANQDEAVGQVVKRFVIRGTVFSTVTVNRNFQAAVHIDEGDLHSGFGALTILTAGTFSGGELVFPQFRIGVDFKMQDILPADVHQPQGNLPMVRMKAECERVSLSDLATACGSPSQLVISNSLQSS